MTGPRRPMHRRRDGDTLADRRAASQNARAMTPERRAAVDACAGIPISPVQAARMLESGLTAEYLRALWSVCCWIARPACTGTAAVWCPNCGDCTCPHDDEGRPTWREGGAGTIGGLNGMSVVHDPACPLHGETAGHPW